MQFCCLVVQKGIENEEDSEEEFTNQFKPHVPKGKEFNIASNQEADQPLFSKIPSDSSDDLQPSQVDHEDMSSSSSSQADVMKLELPASKENITSGNN